MNRKKANKKPINPKKETQRTDKEKSVAIVIPFELAKQADINPMESLEVQIERGKIIIRPSSILGRMPEELLIFYEEMGISRETVKKVMEQEAQKAGGYEKFVESIGRKREE